MKSIVGELRRRNVFKVASVYLITAWIIIQIVSVISPYLHLPTVFGTAITVILLIGFPVVCIFAWAFELTPEGIKPTKDVDKDESISHHTGKKLLTTLGVLLVAAISFIIYDKATLADGQHIVVTNDATDAVDKASSTNSADSNKADEKNVGQDVDAKNLPLSIAVLPFVNMSSDQENEFFSDGLTEEILNKLARVPKLQVTARTSSFFYKGTNEDLRDIGSKLGVSYILEGSVRKSNDIARITAQLIRVKDGFHLWSDTFDKNLTDIFQVQDEISENVANALNIVLDDKSRQAMREAGVGDVEAFVAYQKGEDLYNKAHSGGDEGIITALMKANKYYDIAIEHEPKFAQAYFKKSDLYSHKILEGIGSIEQQELALKKMQELTQLGLRYTQDPLLKKYAQIDSTFYSNDWRNLNKYISQITEIDSCANNQWLSFLRPFGYDTLLDKINDKALSCNPLSTTNYLGAIASSFVNKHYEKVFTLIEQNEKVTVVHDWALQIKLLTYLTLGETESALATIDEINNEYSIANAKYIYWSFMKDKAKALDAYNQLNSIYPNEEDRIKLQMHAMLGEREQANQLATQIDAQPAGPFKIMLAITTCFCGAPFDLEATPNLKKRLKEAGINWPPKKPVDFPLKDW